MTEARLTIGERQALVAAEHATHGCACEAIRTVVETIITARLARVEALAEQWNSTPDYTPSDYDQGRVDQRHNMTMQLLEALTENGEGL